MLLFLSFFVFGFVSFFRWSFVDDVALIFPVQQTHVSDWQPSILLGMIEARSIYVSTFSPSGCCFFTLLLLLWPRAGFWTSAYYYVRIQSTNQSIKNMHTHTTRTHTHKHWNSYTDKKDWLWFWCPCMEINVSVQYNGGLLPDIILLTRCGYIGESVWYHEEVLPLQPMLFRPKPSDIFSPGGGCSEGLDAFRFFLNNKYPSLSIFPIRYTCCSKKNLLMSDACSGLRLALSLKFPKNCYSLFVAAALRLSS